MAVNSHWANEKVRYALIAVIGAVAGMIIGNLWMGLALTFMLYCAFVLFQARAVDKWIQQGAKRSSAPDTFGVLGHIEQLIFRRKRSDSARKQRMKKIVGLYNRSAAALPDGTVVTNSHYQIVWANEAAQKYLGIRGARDNGQRIDNLVRNPAFQHFVRTPPDDNEELEIKSPVNNQLILAIRRVSYAENLFLFTARDVSQRVQLRETRKAFVANASHELKTPLTVVSGYLEMLADDKSLPEHTQRQIHMADSHAQRMTAIVTDLLTLSRLENQELDASKLSELNMATLLDTVVERLSTPETNFIVEADPAVNLIASDTEIESVCTNLCENAAKHNAPGTSVRVSWCKTPDGARLEVSDNGQGIDPQHLKHVTERFYRGDSESGGTGLGLSIVKHIVQRHEAELDIRSIQGEGTTMRITFPSDSIVSRKAA